jgi:hypothetical protein
VGNKKSNQVLATVLFREPLINLYAIVRDSAQPRLLILSHTIAGAVHESLWLVEPTKLDSHCPRHHKQLGNGRCACRIGWARQFQASQIYLWVVVSDPGCGSWEMLPAASCASAVLDEGVDCSPRRNSLRPSPRQQRKVTTQSISSRYIYSIPVPYSIFKTTLTSWNTQILFG